MILMKRGGGGRRGEAGFETAEEQGENEMVGELTNAHERRLTHSSFV